MIGDAVNTAARLCSEAGPGEILIAEPLHAALTQPPPVSPLTPLPLRGKARPVPVYRIEWQDVAMDSDITGRAADRDRVEAPSPPRPLLSQPSARPTAEGGERAKTAKRRISLQLSLTNHSLFSPSGRVEGWEKRAGVMRATPHPRRILAVRVQSPAKF